MEFRIIFDPFKGYKRRLQSNWKNCDSHRCVGRCVLSLGVQEALGALSAPGNHAVLQGGIRAFSNCEMEFFKKNYFITRGEKKMNCSSVFLEW